MLYLKWLWICQLVPGQVAQLVWLSSPYTKVAGWIPGQSTYKKNQPMDASNKYNTKPMFLSLSPSSLSIKKKNQ